MRGKPLGSSPEAMGGFLDCVFDDFMASVDLVRRRAQCDYSPDDTPRRFSGYRFRTPSVSRGLGKTAFDLFETYIRAVQPSSATVNRARVVFRTLDVAAATLDRGHGG